MSLDLTGLTNRNEYYSQHYLLALLEGDLRELFTRWNQTAADNPDSEAHRPPPDKIRGLGASYFRTHNRLDRLRDPEVPTCSADGMVGLVSRSPGLPAAIDLAHGCSRRLAAASTRDS